MRAFMVAIVAALALGGCEQSELSADGAWVRLPAVADRPGAAYFNVKGGPEATSLIDVSSPAALRTEVHEMKNENGMMTMIEIDDVAIPAGETVAFEPGGKHVMLYDISPEVRADATVPLRLSFANGKTIEVEAKVHAAGGAVHKGH